MRIDRPTQAQVPQLRELWKEAFGDDDDFLDGFFASADPLSHSLCSMEGRQVTAALYWFACLWQGKTVAYLYGVATARAYRGQGLCSRLMESTHQHLARQGYAGCLLVPASGALASFYGRFGYAPATRREMFSCTGTGTPVPVGEISPEAYAKRRRVLLPPGGVVQEEENLAFLQTQYGLFAGDGVLLAARTEGGVLECAELLGNREKAPGITAFFHCREGRFRVPGGQEPFAMYRSLDGTEAMPAYFGLAFDV